MSYTILNLSFQSIFPFKLNSNFTKNRIFIKFFLYFLTMYNINNKAVSSIFYNTSTSKTKTILRSPNRHKIAQFHIIKKIFKFKFKFKLNININFSDFLCKIIMNKLNFESSFIYLSKINISSKILLKIK